MRQEAPKENVPQTFRDILRTFPGEWILSRITRFDERQQPIEGIVIAHSDNESEVVKAMPTRENRDPNARYSFRFSHISPSPSASLS